MSNTEDKKYEEIEKKVNRLQDVVTDHSCKIATLEEKVKQVDEKMTDMKPNTEAIIRLSAQMDMFDTKLTSIDASQFKLAENINNIKIAPGKAALQYILIILVGAIGSGITAIITSLIK